MKGLFLKEFYVWLRTRSFYLLGFTALLILSAHISDSFVRFPYACMGMIIGTILNSYMLDEKSGWDKYAKAMPYTPFQRVTVKYVFNTLEYMFLVITQSVALIISSQNETLYSFSPNSVYIETVLNISLSLIALAFCIPPNILIKGNKRYAFASIPILLYIFIFLNLASAIRYSLPGWISQMFTENPWVYPVIILLAFGVFAASWMITVMLEAGKDKAYRKKYALRASAFGAATVVLLSSTLGILYSAGALPDPTFSSDFSSAQTEKTKSEMNRYYDSLCGESNIRKTADECAEALSDIGYTRKAEASEVFVSESGNVFVTLSTDKKTGLVKSIYVSTLIYMKKIEGATDEDFEEIGKNFTSGMPEKELQRKIKELELIPSSISENVSKEEHQRIYYLKFTDKEPASNTVLSSDTRAMSVKVIDGVVEDVEITFYKDGSSVSLIPDSPLEAREEMRSLLDNFCTANHLEMTPDETGYTLESIGFVSRNPDSMNYSSSSGSITAKVISDEETGLTDYIYISGDVGEFTIKQASKEDIEAICNNFEEDMSEAALIQKFRELGVVPHEILESRNYEGKHLRNYEVTYTVESYIGGEGTDYEINIDVIDGKVFDIRTYTREI